MNNECFKEYSHQIVTNDTQAEAGLYETFIEEPGVASELINRAKKKIKKQNIVSFLESFQTIKRAKS